MQRRLLALLAAAVGVLTLSAASVAAPGNGNGDANKLQGIKHIVVIYEENHSFDNLYGGWEGVTASPTPTRRTRRRSTRPATPYLPQAERREPAGATSPPETLLDATPGTPGGPFTSHFTNEPFTIDDYIKPTRPDVPAGPVGVRPLERLASGLNRRDASRRPPVAAPATSSTASTTSSTSSTAASRTATSRAATPSGLTMGTYDTKALPDLPVPAQAGHPNYAIADTSSRPRSADRS